MSSPIVERLAFEASLWTKEPANNPGADQPSLVFARRFAFLMARAGQGEQYLPHKEALSDLRSLRQEHADLHGGGPDWSKRNAAAWARVDELFADEDEAAWERRQEDAFG